MANWFKVYETDLDETRLKYALDKLPEVGWVWMGILSECCKHRSDTIRWSHQHHELFGFSDRLKVSIQKLNEAIKLLHEIEYIVVEGHSLKVLKWKDKQSEYCVRKERGDYRRVSENIGGSPLEERRGEEKRVEEKRGCTPPSLKEVLDVASMRMIPPADAENFWHHFNASGWIDKNHNPVVVWQSALMRWMTSQRSNTAETFHHANGQPKRVETKAERDARTVLEAQG